ncbi:hypothetical protein L1049_015339 [Liquidambar formosana]|uniref:Uncharacterized protein n=1 Tax=Liquidambar formosana TaxID=63359 RepID=A0AAP0X2G4_LIQFO
MPIPPSDGGYVQYFGEFRGHLHKIMTYDPLDVEFDIWELKTDCSRWFIRYHVNLDAVIAAFQGIAWNLRFLKFSVLCVARAEKEEESTLVLFVAGKAISFSLNNDISKKLCDLVPCDKNEQYALDYQCWDTFQYIETLFHV